MYVPRDEATTTTLEVGPSVGDTAPTAPLQPMVFGGETGAESGGEGGAPGPITRVVVQNRQEHGLLIMLETASGVRRQVAIPHHSLVNAKELLESVEDLVVPVDQGPSLGPTAIELLTMLVHGSSVLEHTEDLEDLGFDSDPVTELLQPVPRPLVSRAREEQIARPATPVASGVVVAAAAPAMAESHKRVPRGRRRPREEGTTGILRGIGLVEVVVLLGLGASMGLALLVMVLAVVNGVVEERRAASNPTPPDAAPIQTE